jgi:hypothetical protein
MALSSRPTMTGAYFLSKRVFRNKFRHKKLYSILGFFFLSLRPFFDQVSISRMAGKNLTRQKGDENDARELTLSNVMCFREIDVMPKKDYGISKFKIYLNSSKNRGRCVEPARVSSYELAHPRPISSSRASLSSLGSQGKCCYNNISGVFSVRMFGYIYIDIRTGGHSGDDRRPDRSADSCVTSRY